MKRLISRHRVRVFVVTVVCFLAGVVIIPTGKLQSQNVQTEEKIKQIEKPIPPKPKVDMIPEANERDTSSGTNQTVHAYTIETQKIFRLKIKIKSEQEQKIVERIGLACEGKTECICNATLSQLEELKSAGIEFVVEKEGIKIKKGSAYGQNENNYWIPQGSWTYSPITITSAPAGATVTSIDVYYEVIHTYIGDLIIDLTDQDLGHEWNLWYYEGGSGDNIEEAEWDITEFNGELVNQTWKLWGYDCCSGDDGYIDYWSIQIWYEDPPDLIVQSLTTTDYMPTPKNFQKMLDKQKSLAKLDNEEEVKPITLEEEGKRGEV